MTIETFFLAFEGVGKVCLKNLKYDIIDKRQILLESLCLQEWLLHNLEQKINQLMKHDTRRKGYNISSTKC